MSSEKIRPSPLNIAADLEQAIALDRRQNPRKSQALRDCLNRSVADYNAMVTNRKHRIDSARKCMIYNLSLGLTARRGSKFYRS